jgi:hypothetical protein
MALSAHGHRRSGRNIRTSVRTSVLFCSAVLLSVSFCSVLSDALALYPLILGYMWGITVAHCWINELDSLDLGLGLIKHYFICGI